MENITAVLPTHREARESIDRLISRFNDSQPLEETDIQRATLGVANSLQIRDYLMGAIGVEISTPEDGVFFISALESIGTQSAHLIAVKSAYYYEAGNSIGANLAIAGAFKLDSENALASLLRRVYSAGWSPESFATMRDSLHPKVSEKVEELAEIIVGQE